MKIKNILYVASFMAFAGINAAEQGAVTVSGQAAPREDVTVNIPGERISAQHVLNRFELLVPASHAVQKDFLGRMGDRVRRAGTYGYHIGKYPLVACGVCLPFVIKFKDDLFGAFSESINGLVYGVVGAATVIGIYKGPGDARRQFELDKILEEAPLNKERLCLAAGEIAESANMEKSIIALTSKIEAQEQAALRRAEEQQAQFQAEIERQKAEEAALRRSIAEQTELAEHTSSNLAQLRAEAVEVANGVGSLLKDGLAAQFDKHLADFTRIDEWHKEVLAIENNAAGLTIEGLERLAIIKRQQGLVAFGKEARAILTPDMSTHIATLPERQREQLMEVVGRYAVRVDEYATISASLNSRVPALEGRIKQQLSLTSGQGQLTLVAAATMTPAAPSATVRPEVESSRFSMAVFNSFGSGSRVLSLRGQRPVTPPAETTVQVTAGGDDVD